MILYVTFIDKAGLKQYIPGTYIKYSIDITLQIEENE